jgi:hypothetical protein
MGRIYRTPKPKQKLPPLNLTKSEVALAQLAATINEAHLDVQRHFTAVVRRAIDAGIALHDAKELVPHGAWSDWTKANCKFSERTAQLYMEMAKHLRAMPDLEVKLAELSLNEAHRFLAGNFDRRFRNRALELRQLEAELCDHARRMREILCEMREIMDPAKFAAWLASRSMPAEIAETYMDGAIAAADKQLPRTDWLPAPQLPRPLAPPYAVGKPQPNPQRSLRIPRNPVDQARRRLQRASDAKTRNGAKSPHAAKLGRGVERRIIADE